MKRLLSLSFLLLFSLSAYAQSLRVYYVSQNQVTIADGNGSNPDIRPVNQVNVRVVVGDVLVSYGGNFRFLSPAQFLNNTGTAWGATPTAAVDAFKASVPTSGTGTGGSTTDASQLTTGTLPEARLPATAVTTAGSQTISNKTLASPTLTGTVIVPSPADSDSSNTAITTAWYKRNVPRFYNFPYNRKQFSFGDSLTILPAFIQGVGVTFNSATQSFSVAGAGSTAPANLTVTTDVANTSSQALYLFPTNNQDRIFLGTAAKTVFAVDFRFVSGVDNFPGFRSNGGLQFGGNSDAAITRTNNVVQFNSASNGTGVDNGYRWYGSNTGYSSITDATTSTYMVLQEGKLGLTQFTNGSGTTFVPSAKLDVTGATGYNQFRLRTAYTPTGTADTNGQVGDHAWDDNFHYVKTSAGWKRSALTTF